MKNFTTTEEWVTYIPEFDGNREDQNPITCEIRPLTVRESKQIAGGVTARRAKGGGFQTNQAALSLKTFENHVRNIQNLTVNGQPVMTVEELLATPLNELAGEIEAAVNDISVLDEGDIKNFVRRSDGSFERKGGTATTAPSNSSDFETAEDTSGETTGRQS